MCKHRCLILFLKAFHWLCHYSVQNLQVPITKLIIVKYLCINNVMESRTALLAALSPRKARVGHGTSCRESTLTSEPLSFICTAHMIRPALVLPEKRCRKYVERLDLCLLEVLEMKKLHEKVCLSCENSKGTTMTSCLQWLNAQNGTGFEQATVTQVVGKAVWSC